MDGIIALSLTLKLLAGEKVVISRMASTNIEDVETVSTAAFALLNRNLADVFSHIFIRTITNFNNQLVTPADRVLTRITHCVVTVELKFDEVDIQITESSSINGRNLENGASEIAGRVVIRVLRKVISLCRSHESEVS